jgi:hypothetical protein
MRTTFENKTLNLSLSEDQQNIVAAERRMSAAKRRLDETEREIRRAKEDADLFSRSVDPDHLRALEYQAKQDAELVAKCERELADAKAEPERRAARDKRGAEVKRDMQNTIREIEAWAAQGGPLMAKADALVQTVIDEFTRNRGGWNLMDEPFKDDEARTLLERLRFFARTTGAHGDTETFADRLARYRKIGEPTKPVEPPKSAAPLGVYVRSKPLPRQARENAAARLTLTPAGVVTETRRS